MLKLSSPAISTASFTSQDWIMNSEDGCVLDTPTAGRNLTSSYEGMDDLVMSNGYPMSSSPHLQEFIKEEPDGPFVSPQRRNSDIPNIMGIQRTRSFDPNLFNIRQVSPEKIAEQLTLIDLSLLKSIAVEEFHDCKFEKKDRRTTTPNIVNFSRRFNHTSFWVVRDILNETNVKLRAEIVVKFLHIARHLQELNNIHSLVAMVLAVKSLPIDRLTHTWKLVPKKEKQSLEKMAEFVSEQNNYSNLREHMDKVFMPCIPHLGLHQKDLVFLSTLSKRSGATSEDKKQCAENVAKIYDLIETCQSSTYDALMPVKYIQKFLNSLRYIDELQKFYEDDNYKLSLEREPAQKLQKLSCSALSPRPPPHPKFSRLRYSKSQEDLLGAPLKPEITGILTPPRRPISGRFSESNLLSKNKPETKDVPSVQVTQVTLGDSLHSTPLRHQKQRTLPADMKDLSLKALAREGGTKSAELSGNNCCLSEDARKKFKNGSPSVGLNWHRGHSKSHSVGNNGLNVFGIPSRSQAGNGRGGSSPELPPHPISLLDDSVLDDTTLVSNNLVIAATTASISSDYFTPPISTASSSSLDTHSFDEELEVFLQDNLELEDLDLKDSDVIREGILKRRVLVKNGHHTQFKLSHKYWVKLTQKSLILFPRKYKDSPKKPNQFKGISLLTCCVKHEDPFTPYLKKTQFLIVDDRHNQTRFTASSPAEASGWAGDIRDVIERLKTLRKKQEQAKPLIKL